MKGWLTQARDLETIEPIGRGGMGQVWKGYRHLTSGKTSARQLVAIKILAPKKADRFFQRPETFLNIQHEGINRYLGFGTVSNPDHPLFGKRYIILEYIRGQTLEEILRALKGCSPGKRSQIIWYLGCKLSEALTHLHSARLNNGRAIVHNDLKPSNIMVTPDGGLKLVDLGVARVANRRASPEEFTPAFGTPAYQAPEFAHAAPARVSSDLFSFGIILLELLTGEPAEKIRINPTLTLEQISPELLPPELKPVIRDSISPKPGDRPTALELSQKLSRYLAPEMKTILARIVQASMKESPTASRHPLETESELKKARRKSSQSSGKMKLFLSALVLLTTLAPNFWISEFSDRRAGTDEPAWPTGTQTSPIVCEFEPWRYRYHQPEAVPPVTHVPENKPPTEISTHPTPPIHITAGPTPTPTPSPLNPPPQDTCLNPQSEKRTPESCFQLAQKYASGGKLERAIAIFSAYCAAKHRKSCASLFGLIDMFPDAQTKLNIATTSCYGGYQPACKQLCTHYDHKLRSDVWIWEFEKQHSFKAEKRRYCALAAR